MEHGSNDFLSLDEIKKEQEKYKLYSDYPFVDCDRSRTNVAEHKEDITAMLDKVAQQVRENTEMWTICEMAKQWVLDQKRHGRWIKTQEDRWIYPICSECGYKENVVPNYCANCGAKMDKEDK